MILTEQAKKDFYDWVFNTQQDRQMFGDLEDVYDWFDSSPESCKYALMIEWFDSVGIYINTVYEEFEDTQVGGFTVFIKSWSAWILSMSEDELIIDFKTRLEATAKAIEKAKEIYNQRFEI